MYMRHKHTHSHHTYECRHLVNEILAAYILSRQVEKTHLFSTYLLGEGMVLKSTQKLNWMPETNSRTIYCTWIMGKNVKNYKAVNNSGG